MHIYRATNKTSQGSIFYITFMGIKADKILLYIHFVSKIKQILMLEHIT